MFKFNTKNSCFLPALIVLMAFSADLFPQLFTEVTDTTNPVVNETAAPPAFYIGASWVDYDNDGDIDLFVNNDLLYRNEGGGQFSKITDSGLGSMQIGGGFGHGNSWADYDNDGDLDCMISGMNSFLYINDGQGSFMPVTDGEIGNGFANRGWSSAWGDYDNDGYVDMMITHPAGFLPNGPAIPSHFFHNQSGTLVRVDTFDFTAQLAPYTVGTWADYDLDGDIDLFIGSGPASGTPAPDRLYHNNLSENGQASLDRITQGIIATDPVDGQVWNWIDYDNDGDLDAYLTNYGAAANSFYRNDDGTMLKLNSTQVGDLVLENGGSLANVWADFDHDGDVDVYTTNDGAAPANYYENDGNGMFVKIDTLAITGKSIGQVCAATGDYDKDGDLDLYVSGPSAASKSLYENHAAENGRHWVNIHCNGVTSNKSAIGTTVRAKASVNGNPTWQIRQVSSQNSFNGHNSMNVHFGFGDAAVIDSLVFHWPSGQEDVYTNVSPDVFYAAVEGQSLGVAVGIRDDAPQLSEQFHLYENYPNPFNPSTTIRYQLAQAAQVKIVIYNLLGQEVKTLVLENQTAGEYSVNWTARNNAGKAVSSGMYIYKMTAAGYVQTRKMLLVR